MFIPLNASEIDGLNVLIVGDTAAVFYILGQMNGLKARLFVADTGVYGSSPLQFKNRENRGPDVAAAYYDFFESIKTIGAGIFRRADLIVCSSPDNEMSELVIGKAKTYRVPVITIDYKPSKTIFKTYGLTGIDVAGCHNEMDVLRHVHDKVRCCNYREYTETIEVDGNTIKSIQRGEFTRVSQIVPYEQKFSAWDRLNDILSPGEILYHNGIEYKGDDCRLIQLGIPELDIVSVLTPRGVEFRELAGDYGRVYDVVV